ncbi:GIY-YIG nuclease family protein [Leucobacter chromiireducens]|nr:GIY-YIG nuclease family protein [Leucobacter chromiireducens]
MSSIQHFGVAVRTSKRSPMLVRSEYLVQASTKATQPWVYLEMASEGKITAARMAELFVDPETCVEYSPEWVASQREAALRNFDLNMLFFRRLNQLRFNDEVAKLLAAHPELREVTDLRTVAGEPGIYVMVLDGYRQLYVGQSVDVTKRIRAHWSKSKPLDRLIFGDAESSILSIDAFRALDTTRVFAVTGDLLDDPYERNLVEQRMAASVDPDLSLNRVSGGDFQTAAFAVALGEMKTRDLSATDEEWAAYRAELAAAPEPAPRLVVPAKVKRAVVPEPDFDDPVGQLVRVANREKRGGFVLVDAGGMIVDVVAAGGVTTGDRRMQLFAVPTGRSISREKMERAVAKAGELVREVTQPREPVELFELLGSSGVAVRG